MVVDGSSSFCLLVLALGFFVHNRLVGVGEGLFFVWVQVDDLHGFTWCASALFGLDSGWHRFFAHSLNYSEQLLLVDWHGFLLLNLLDRLVANGLLSLGWRLINCSCPWRSWGLLEHDNTGLSNIGGNSTLAVWFATWLGVALVIRTSSGTLLRNDITLVGETPIQIWTLAWLANHFEPFFKFGSHRPLAVFAVPSS